MSLSLVAVFIPILLMGGMVGRLFREFAVTLSVAMALSLVGVPHDDAHDVRGAPQAARRSGRAAGCSARASGRSRQMRRRYERSSLLGARASAA